MSRQTHNGYFALLGVLLGIVFWGLETLVHVYVFKTGSFLSQLLPVSDPNEFWMRIVICLLLVGFGLHAQKFTDRRRLVEQQRERLIIELQRRLAEIRELRGMLPICAHCKKIRDDRGYWEAIETYLHSHQQIDFTHSICPECLTKFYPEVAKIPRAV